MSLWRPITASTYWVTWVLLALLAALSFGLSYAPLGSFDASVALTIAVMKAALVAFFFMHLAEHSFAYRLVMLVGILFVLIMVSFTVLDVVTREEINVRPPVSVPR